MVEKATVRISTYSRCKLAAPAPHDINLRAEESYGNNGKLGEKYSRATAHSLVRKATAHRLP